MPLGDADRMPLIDCRVDGSVTCPETTSLARWLAPNGRATPLDNLEITRLRPGAGVTVLVSESCKEGDKTVDCPAVVESSCGLGRVWLTAFDLDEGPFAAREWSEGRKAFWSRVQAEFTPKPAAVARRTRTASARTSRRRCWPRCSARWRTLKTSPSSASAGWRCSYSSTSSSSARSTTSS